MSKQSFSAWIRHPGSILLIITVVLMLVIMSEQSQQQPANGSAGIQQGPGTLPTLSVTSKNTDNGKPKMGSELPRIVRQFSAPLRAPSIPAGSGAKPAGTPGRLKAPDLGSLLGRLEEKVKTDPGNISNRLLLAQTYNELGFSEKSLVEIRAALVQAPEHARAQLVLASILSTRQDEAGLKEAKTLLDGLKSSDEIKQYLVAMYLGDTFIRMGDHGAALKSWQQALEKMPISDNRRAQIEKRIADLSTVSPGA